MNNTLNNEIIDNLNNKEIFKLYSKKFNLNLFVNYEWYTKCYDNNTWEVIVIKKKNNVIAIMPFFLKKFLGFTIINLPNLHPWLELWINEKNLNVKKYNNILSQIINKLPKYDYLNINIYNLISPMQFHWHNYNVNYYQTCVIDYLYKDKISKILSSTKKQNIKKAITDKVVLRRNYINSEDFYNFHIKTLKRKIFYSHLELSKIFNYIINFNRGFVISAYKKNELVANALFIISNKECILLISNNDEKKCKNALNYIIYKALIISKRIGCKTFNFEGSMTKGVFNSYMAFGSNIKGYYNIKKINSNLLKIAIFFINLLKVPKLSLNQFFFRK